MEEAIVDRNEPPVEENTVGLRGGSGIYWIKVKEYEDFVYHSGKVNVNRRSKPRTKHKVNIKNINSNIIDLPVTT